MLAAHLSLDMHARQARLIGELEQSNDQLVRTNIHLQRVNLSFAEAMVSALDARDDWTADHSAHVALYSRDIAEELAIADEDVARVHLCALVHDIGKIGVPAEVLEKTSALNDEEWAAMREHSAIGATILGQVAGYGDVAAVVRSHHERWDGAGYPDGLAADQIPLMSRIISVADSYNAMTKDRPYRRAMAPEEALKQLQLGKWSQIRRRPGGSVPARTRARVGAVPAGHAGQLLGRVGESPRPGRDAGRTSDSPGPRRLTARLKAAAGNPDMGSRCPTST